MQSEQTHGYAVFPPQSLIFKPFHHVIVVLLDDIFASVVQHKDELLL